MYPGTVREGERWLDGSGGRTSVHAAVLRAADGSGYARGSDWCPGLDTSSAASAPDAAPVLGLGSMAGHDASPSAHEEPSSAAADASSRDAGAPLPAHPRRGMAARTCCLGSALP